MEFKYEVSDITKRKFDTPTCICQVNNDQNILGSGLALAIAKRWVETKVCYHQWFDGIDFKWLGPAKLGRNQYLTVENRIYVINMIAQSDCGGYQPKNGPYIPPIRYQSLRECLYRFKDWMLEGNKLHNVVTGLIGCERAGGDPAVIKRMVYNIFEELDFTWTWISPNAMQLEEFKAIEYTVF